SDVSASGINPSPQALSTGGSTGSATVTRNPREHSAIAEASPTGPPPTMKTSVCKLNIHHSARQTERFRPEGRRSMHQIGHRRDRAHEFVHLPLFDYQRRSGLEHHEIVPADLRQDALIAEQTHHHQLPEHGRMNVRESLKGNP